MATHELLIAVDAAPLERRLVWLVRAAWVYRYLPAAFWLLARALLWRSASYRIGDGERQFLDVYRMVRARL